jgi:hypothetical protein
MNNQLEITWVEAVVTGFKTASPHSSEEADENHGKPQSVQPVSGW